MTTNANASLWGQFEIVLDGPSEGNPFRDVTLAARFEHGATSLVVPGFYDGDGVYRIRFMPTLEGDWHYAITSNAPSLDGVSGTVSVGPAKPGDRGPVRVSDQFHFRYADGSRFINIGTTAYAWNHQSGAMEEETLASLASAPFTKIRMCVFPKHYRYNENEPEFYPFPVVTKGSSAWPGQGDASDWEFDFDRFEPEFFRHLEQRIADLGRIGVEADLILFHPYDRWGFSRMSAEQDDSYLRYLIARLAALPNIWWSMANEYDLMPSKNPADWDRFLAVVAEADPYDHLRGVHNCFAFYDHTHDLVTHCSIQRPNPFESVLWRERYGKPISVDECCYEGDIGEPWGNISGQEMVHRFWAGTVAGGYVTHGETFHNPGDAIWWAKGGTLRGESVERIAFLRKIMEQGPERGLDPHPTLTRRIMLAGGMDAVNMDVFRKASEEAEEPRVLTGFHMAGQPHEYYLYYFGQNQPGEVFADVPAGEHYDATLIDTWEMTETPLASGVARGQALKFAAKPYQALLLKRAG